MPPQKNPEMRIVSLAPSATSILCAIGAKKLLVGVTKWCCDVAPVAGSPQVGDCWHMESVTDVVKLRPTLVIGSVPYKQEVVGKLLEQRLNFLAMNPRTLEDVYGDIRLLGGIAGRVAQAETLIRKMRSEFAAIERAAGKLTRRPRVYCEAWPNPRISSPPWVAELVKICGGEIVVPAAEKVTDAQVAEARPEMIVLAWAATGERSNPKQPYSVEAWKDLPAIQERRVFVVRDELLNTPGPPLMKGARELSRLLQLGYGKKKNLPQAEGTERRMRTVVAAVIEREDRRLLIGQRRKDDSSPLKWEFPGGKVREDEAAEAALARELREELGATLTKCEEMGRVRHQYAESREELEIRFFAAAIAEGEVRPLCFEQIAWVLPKELSDYDFLAANRELVANLATGRVKPADFLERS
jgi:mutator protein MutT